jgi:hypothetical protein
MLAARTIPLARDTFTADRLRQWRIAKGSAMKFHFTLFAAVGLAALISSDQAKAQLLDLGTTYTIEGQGFTGTGSPPSFTEMVALSSSTVTFDNRKLQITVTQTPWHTLAPIRSGVFAEFYIRAPRHSRVSSPPPLVDPSTDTVANNVFFEVGVSGVQLKVPAIYNFNSVYWNFTRNGVADAGITASPGSGAEYGVKANPNPGSIGAGKNVFYLPNCFMCNETPASQIRVVLGQGDPFINFVKNLNIDPKFNGYFLGLKLEYPPFQPY